MHRDDVPLVGTAEKIVVAETESGVLSEQDGEVLDKRPTRVFLGRFLTIGSYDPASAAALRLGVGPVRDAPCDDVGQARTCQGAPDCDVGASHACDRCGRRFCRPHALRHAKRVCAPRAT